MVDYPDERRYRRRSGSERLRRGAYLLPSVFTIGNIFLGFFSVVSALRGDIARAAVLVFLAGILDGLDGRIARLTGTESDFGREFDALADVVTFGVTPAMLAYLDLTWGGYGRLAWLVPLLYLVSTATRLARFNVQTRTIDSRYFVGLPAPAAAATIAALLLVAHDRELTELLRLPLLIGLLAIGSLMVSTFRYPSFKRFDLRQRWSYRVALPLTAALIIILYDPPIFFATVTVLYAGWPPLAWLLERLGLRRRPEAASLTEEEMV